MSGDAAEAREVAAGLELCIGLGGVADATAAITFILISSDGRLHRPFQRTYSAPQVIGELLELC